LDIFIQSWNYHSLRTENHKTPRQLYLEGMVNNNFRDLDLNIEINNYGIDWDGPIPIDNEIEQVNIDPINNILSNLQLNNLQNIVNPLAEDGNYGINLYLNTLEFIQNLNIEN
jgi:hypothetical protein